MWSMCTNSWILFSFNPDTRYSMEALHQVKMKATMRSEVRQTKKDRYCMIPLLRVVYKSQVQGAESRMEVTRGWEERRRRVGV